MEQSQSGGDANPKDASAVSIFGQAAGGATGQFPVLKAFQEYIEAEQAHARKRMIELSVFFAVLMMIVIVAFVFAWTHAMNRNQQLSDKLLDLALRERGTAAAPVVVNPPAGGSTAEAMKPILDQLAGLTTAIKENRAQQPATQPAAPATTTQDDLAARRIQARLDQQENDLRAERSKLRETQEKLHQMEVEQQRRRLYPEYYATHENKEGETSRTPAAPPVAPGAQSHSPSAANRAQAQARPKPADTAKAAPTSADKQPSDLQPISYFPDAAASDVTTRPAITPSPVRPMAQTSSAVAPDGTVDYVLPLETKKQGTVSWRIYIPE